MKKQIFTLIVFVCCFLLSIKAQTPVSVDVSFPISTKLDNARYEFIQSVKDSNRAFLLDKYTGKVWRYRVIRKEFEEMTREQPDEVVGDKVNYQMYISGENSSMCFLLNIHTGEMWRYVWKDSVRIFEKMKMPWNY